MTKSKFNNPRSKVRSRPDGSTVTSTIPAKIAHAMRLQAGDSIEWIWVTEGYNSFAKVAKVSE